MKMNKTIKIVLSITLCIILCFLYLRFLVVIGQNTTWRNSNYCSHIYQTKDYQSDGDLGRYCAKLNHTSNEITRYYYTKDEMLDYCNRIGFFEFTKWEDVCGFFKVREEKL